METEVKVKKKKTGLKVFLSIVAVLLIAAVGFIIYADRQETMYEQKSKEAGKPYSMEKVENKSNNQTTLLIEKEVFKEYNKMFDGKKEENLGDGLYATSKFDENTRTIIFKVKDKSEDKSLKYYLVDGNQADGKENKKELENIWNDMLKSSQESSKELADVGLKNFSFVVLNPYNEKNILLKVTDGKVVYDFHNDLKKDK
ncbi:hypothetical protein [Peptostreptococcus equinus]|uniref:DUF5067 domain-containing protein n=1 Tax=Peptostreptococcus equinus TaxID=3003601 RepID=A0ABY7JRW1_9FIRM|nr:hypothetical protein [Peptostreptococcus sp. CBA3647]WAW14793.1 hypothetical protein O0R46_09445 [Peptostreptococcus sp. CBA3647]